MLKKSAGILLYRLHNNLWEVFLVHPGGPFWKKKELGVWSIPKGEFAENEDPLDAAKREVEEETGIKAEGKFEALSPVKLKSGKIIFAWALQKDTDPSAIRSNSFEIGWPPKSPKKVVFPEIDKAAWFSIAEGKKKINKGQIPLLEELERNLSSIDKSD